ncbi:MAG TPA: hypothetical protein VFV81_03130, partial [Verrucomicrobiae bacterium]|nr:hypothetical protein [Verrucomicrobiae bacterium]
MESASIPPVRMPDQLKQISRPPELTPLRIFIALATAIAADGLQFFLGGFGWIGPDQGIDVAAMLVTMWALGFHWLLLPTFILDFIPVVDAMPTWIACVVVVIVLRRREERRQRRLAEDEKPVIDV